MVVKARSFNMQYKLQGPNLNLTLLFFPEICTVVSALHCVWSNWSVVWALKLIVARDLEQPFVRNYIRPAGVLILEAG